MVDNSGMTTAELLAMRICQLEKCQSDVDQAAQLLTETCMKSKEQFEGRYQ